MADLPTAHSGHRPSARRARIFAVVSAALAVLATLTVCEIGLRLVNVGPRMIVFEGIRLSADPALVYELAPGASVLEDTFPVSAAGLRDQEYATVPPPHTFRIAVVGDSVAYGYNVRRPETMAKVLERLLADVPSRVPTRYEVLNFGVSGYNSGQIARRIETAVSAFGPDLVLYVYCLNDPDDLDNDVTPLLAPLDPGQRRTFEALVRHAGSVFSGLRLYGLVIGTVDAVRLGRRGGLPTVISPTDAPEYYVGLHADGQRWERAQADMQRMGSAVRRMPARWVAAISPYLWKEGDRRRGAQEPALRETTTKIARALRTSGAAVLDLATPLSRVEASSDVALSLDEVHYSAAGHTFAAVAVLDFLLRESLLPGVGARSVAALQLADPAASAISQALR